MVLYMILAVCLTVGVIWVVGYRKTAYTLTAIPVLILVAGPQLSRALDRICSLVTKTWRRHARLPGRHYCPECARALRPPMESRPVAGDECAACDGVWCDSRVFLRWLAPYGTTEASWRVIPRDDSSPPMLCPECAVPLEFGTLDRLQPLFSRCVACDGHWVARMTWTWFSLTPPSHGVKTVRAAPLPAEPARAPVFVSGSRKNP